MFARIAVFEPMPDDDRQWVIDAAKTVAGVLSISIFEDDVDVAQVKAAINEAREIGWNDRLRPAPRSETIYQVIDSGRSARQDSECIVIAGGRVQMDLLAVLAAEHSKGQCWCIENGPVVNANFIEVSHPGLKIRPIGDREVRDRESSQPPSSVLILAQREHRSDARMNRAGVSVRGARGPALP